MHFIYIQLLTSFQSYHPRLARRCNVGIKPKQKSVVNTHISGQSTITHYRIRAVRSELLQFLQGPITSQGAPHALSNDFSVGRRPWPLVTVITISRAIIGWTERCSPQLTVVGRIQEVSICNRATNELLTYQRVSASLNMWSEEIISAVKSKAKHILSGFVINWLAVSSTKPFAFITKKLKVHFHKLLRYS